MRTTQGSQAGYALPLACFFLFFFFAPLALLAGISLRVTPQFEGWGLVQYAKFAGDSFNWSVLGRRAPAHVYVAGGINPENVEALMRFRPYGIDLAGGVEASPGVKDARRMRALFKAVGGVS